MRVNIYAEEMTERVAIISKKIDGQTFTGLRLYLELPVTHDGKNIRGAFIHRPGDDDSSAVTFWGKRDLRVVLRTMLAELDRHYGQRKEADSHADTKADSDTTPPLADAEAAGATVPSDAPLKVTRADWQAQAAMPFSPCAKGSDTIA